MLHRQNSYWYERNHHKTLLPTPNATALKRKTLLPTPNTTTITHPYRTEQQQNTSISHYTYYKKPLLPTPPHAYAPLPPSHTSHSYYHTQHTNNAQNDYHTSYRSNNPDFKRAVKTTFQYVQLHHHYENWKQHTPKKIEQNLQHLFANIKPPCPNQEFITTIKGFAQFVSCDIQQLVSHHIEDEISHTTTELQFLNPQDKPMIIHTATRQLNRTLKNKIQPKDLRRLLFLAGLELGMHYGSRRCKNKQSQATHGNQTQTHTHTDTSSTHQSETTNTEPNLHATYTEEAQSYQTHTPHTETTNATLNQPQAQEITSNHLDDQTDPDNISDHIHFPPLQTQSMETEFHLQNKQRKRKQNEPKSPTMQPTTTQNRFDTLQCDDLPESDDSDSSPITIKPKHKKLRNIPSDIEPSETETTPEKDQPPINILQEDRQCKKTCEDAPITIDSDNSSIKTTPKQKLHFNTNDSEQSETEPSTSNEQSRKNIHGRTKKQNWKIEQINSNIDTLIIGDSNLKHWQEFPGNWQIESFPGAKLCHITQILNRLKAPENLKYVVISAGINNRDNDLHTNRKQLDKLEEACTNAKFKVFFLETAYAKSLKANNQQTIQTLNNTAAVMFTDNFIENISPKSVQTEEQDHLNIHYTTETSKKIISIIVNFLNDIIASEIPVS